MNINDVDNKNDSLENKAKLKIKDYFKEFKTLTKNNFSKFINHIGLSEIWSTEEEQNIFWEKIVQNLENKNEIDYNTTVNGFKEFFEEEVNDDIDEVEDLENNNLSSNENDNDLLMDIDLQSLHMKSIGFEQEENENFRKKIEEFINNIKDNQNIIYSIRFINEIFFSNNLSQEDVEKNLENNNSMKNFQIDKEEIINEINSKYKFIKLENDFLRNYFNIISKQNDNTKKELLVENSHIEYINKLINDINTKDKKNSLINTLNINLIKTKNTSDIINIPLNLRKLKEYDSMIIECIGVSGAGKTTYINELYNQMVNDGTETFWPRYIMYEKRSWLTRNIKKSYQVIKNIIHNTDWVRKLKNELDLYSKYLTKKDKINLLFNGIALKDMYSHCTKQNAVYVFDEGACQYIWSIALRTGKDIDEEYIVKMYSLFVKADQLFLITATPEIIINRLNNRKRKTRIETGDNLHKRILRMEKIADYIVNVICRNYTISSKKIITQ